MFTSSMGTNKINFSEELLNDKIIKELRDHDLKSRIFDLYFQQTDIDMRKRFLRAKNNVRSRDGSKMVDYFSSYLSYFFQNFNTVYWDYYAPNMLSESDVNCDYPLEVLYTKGINMFLFEFDKINRNKNAKGEIIEFEKFYKKVLIEDSKISIKNALHKLYMEENNNSDHLSFSKIVEALVDIFLSKATFNLEIILKFRNLVLDIQCKDDVYKFDMQKDINPKNIYELFLLDKHLLTSRPCTIGIYYWMTTDLLTKEKYCSRVCHHLYIRFLLDYAIFICLNSHTIYYSNHFIILTLVSVYQKIDYIIYLSLLDYLDDVQHFYHLISSINDNYCIKNTLMISLHNISDITKFIGKLNSNFSFNCSDTINSIAELALKKWNNGSRLDHIDMMNSFITKDKYQDYVNKRGFKNKLRQKLIQICKDNDIHLIRGVDVFPRGYKKS